MRRKRRGWPNRRATEDDTMVLAPDELARHTRRPGDKARIWERSRKALRGGRE